MPDSGGTFSAEFSANRLASGTVRGQCVSPTWDIGIRETGRILGLGPRAFSFLAESDRGGQPKWSRRDPGRPILLQGMDMNRITLTFARLVLAFVAISVVVGCSGRAATEDADEVNDLGAAASRPAAGADGAPLETVTPLLTTPEGATDVMVQEGMQIYAGAGICGACHGPDATGAIGPDLTDGEWLIGDGEYEQLVTQILEGVSATEATNPLGAIMPPKGGAAITEAQVRSVAAYVWALSH